VTTTQVFQTGSVTNGHIATFTTDGVIQDGGAVIANDSLSGGSTTSIASGSTYYCASAGCATSTAIASLVPFTGTAVNLNVALVAAPGAGQTVTATLMTGPYGSLSTTLMTCTISGSATSCLDLADRVNIPAGQAWAVRLVTSGAAAPTAGQSVSLQLISAVPPSPTQPYVLQTGNITSGHQVVWVTNGVVGDSGTVPFGACTALGAFLVGTGGVAQCSNVAGSQAVLNGGPLTINTAANSLNQGIAINQSGPTSGTVSQSSAFQYNGITITSDQVAMTGASIFTYGFGIDMTTGGANSQGSKIAFSAIIRRTAADNTGAPVGDTIGAQLGGIASAPDGGTNTGAGARGSIFGANIDGTLVSGATNYVVVSGAEVDVGIYPGGSANRRLGWSVVGVGTLQGAFYDAAYEIGAVAGASWQVGLMYSSLHGGPGVAASGTLIGTDGTAFTIQNGIDLSQSVTINGSLLAGPGGFSISGAGEILVNSRRFITFLGTTTPYNDLLDTAANSAILLGGGGSSPDPTNIYRNTNHSFQGIGGASIYVTMATGATGIKFNQYGLGLIHSSAAGVLSSSAIVGGDVTLTNAHIFVGNGSNVAADVAMSGDATIANTGALTLASVISAAGPIGGPTSIPVITYDARGRLTAVTTATPTVTSVNSVTYPASYTSGGIPYASGTGTIASSGLLAANQIVLGGGSGTTPATLGSLGTTTTVLHGNAGGAPSFGAVVLTTDVTGILGGSNGGTGINNGASTITISASFTTTGAGAPTLAFPASSFTYTFQASSDTIVGRATTDSFQNKTFNANVNGNVLQLNGNTLSASTGTGATVVLQSSPTLVTPVLGVATATSVAIGGGSIGSDALEVTGTTTHNGNTTIAGASLILSGNFSSAAWTTNGLRLKGVPGTLTDTTSSGTVAAAYTDVLGGNTIAASSATTFTNYISLYAKDPVAGTNVTLTNKWAVGGDSARFGTSNQVTVSNSGVLNATSPVFVTPTLGAATATSINGLIITATLGTLTIPNNASAQLITSGNFALTLTATAATNSTLPAGTHTLAGLDVSQTFTVAQAIAPTIAANTSADGLILSDATAASAGNQQYSPRVRWTGQGWKTNATAASQTVDWIAENQPVQGAANPATSLIFSSQVNAGGYTNNVWFSSLGTVGIGVAPGSTFTLDVKTAGSTYVRLTSVNISSDAAYYETDGTNSASSGLLAGSGCGAGNWAVFASGCRFTINQSGGAWIGTTNVDEGANNLGIQGQLFMPNITTTSAAQTGTVCWTTGTGKFTVDTTLGCLASIEEAKDIVSYLDPDEALRIVGKLRPFSFRYRPGYGDEGRYEQFGLGARQVAAVDERLAGRDFEGNLRGVRYMESAAVLAAAIQKLKADNDDLRSRLRLIEAA
jgi:hypothetical protein